MQQLNLKMNWEGIYVVTVVYKEIMQYLVQKNQH